MMAPDDTHAFPGATSMRIGIINCPGASNYGPMVARMLTAAKERRLSEGRRRGGRAVELVVYEAERMELPSLENSNTHAEPEAYIITGSRHGAYESHLPWVEALKDWIRDAYARQIKVAGVCFGHQILAAAHGATVVANPRGFEIGNLCFSLDNAGVEYMRELTGRPEPVDELWLYYVHNDYVQPGTLPPHLINLGGTLLSPVNAIRDDTGRLIFAFQGHPEFEMDAVMDAVTALKSRNVLPARLPEGEKLEECLKSFEKETHAAYAGEALYAFLSSS